MVARSRRWAQVLWGCALTAVGGGTLVYAAMLTATVETADRKAGGIVLAVAGVWVLSRCGVMLYGMLFAR